MKKKILSLALLLSVAIVLVFALSSCGSDVKIYSSIDCSNSAPGQLWGSITVSYAGTEKCTLYFGDGEGNCLDGYTKIGDVQEGTPFELKGLVIPPDAKTIVAITESGSKSAYQIDEEYLLNKDDAFVFGILSDVHYNKYYSTEGVDDADIAFDRALDYFDKIGVQMVGVTGDLSNDGEESALIKYNDAIKDRAYPVFAVTGNHDVKAYRGSEKLWTKYITDNLKGCTNISDWGDFVYAPEEMGGDVFVFLNVVAYDYANKQLRALRGAQIDWLAEICEEHKEDNVYLFFHLFMCGPDGQGHTGVGNIMNPGGYTYPLPFKYGNADERSFRILMKKYPNVVFFSGHSHWMFEMEKYGEQANYSNFGGEYCHMVHVPSVTEPRWIGDNDTNRTGKNGESSQGWIAYDYGEQTVLVPIDFVTGTIYTEYMEIIH